MQTALNHMTKWQARALESEELEFQIHSLPLTAMLAVTYLALTLFICKISRYTVL